MKKLVVVGMCILMSVSYTLAQGQNDTLKKGLLYTIVYNRVPDNFNVPLIGGYNLAQGNHKGLQLGLYNKTQGDFYGLQAALVNEVKGSFCGIQNGVINVVGNSGNGIQSGVINVIANSGNAIQNGVINVIGNTGNAIQSGVINVIGNSGNGIQSGVINVIGNSGNGIQNGVINNVGNAFKGIQMGAVNIVGNSVVGVQVGVWNTSPNCKGFQLGVLNKVKKIKGVQVGVLNIADSISGIPIGLISIVKKGGYKAVEVGYNEFYPINASFKTGIEKFYTTLGLAYNPDLDKPYAYQVGFGTNIPLSSSLYLNPELTQIVSIEKQQQSIARLGLQVGYNLINNLSVLSGASFSWQYQDENDRTMNKPSFALYENNIDNRNHIIVGIQAGLRYKF